MPPAPKKSPGTASPKRKIPIKVEHDVAELLAETDSGYLAAPIAKAEGASPHIKRHHASIGHRSASEDARKRSSHGYVDGD